MSELKLVLEKDGPIGWIIFNQPEKRNAVSQEMWRSSQMHHMRLALMTHALAFRLRAWVWDITITAWKSS